MKNKKFMTALEYWDIHSFSLMVKFENNELSNEEYIDARNKLFYKCKLFEKKQIVNASKTGYLEGKINCEGGENKYRGAQDYYNKIYGILNTNGSNGK
jgi:hypothetical protein